MEWQFYSFGKLDRQMENWEMKSKTNLLFIFQSISKWNTFPHNDANHSSLKLYTMRISRASLNCIWISVATLHHIIFCNIIHHWDQIIVNLARCTHVAINSASHADVHRSCWPISHRWSHDNTFLLNLKSTNRKVHDLLRYFLHLDQN